MKKNKGIVIELTALLDVILIMLFWLMMNMKEETESVRAQAEEDISAAQQKYSDTLDELEALQTQFDEYVEKHSAISDALSRYPADELAGGRMIILNLKYDAVGKLYISENGSGSEKLLLDSAEKIEESLSSLLSDTDGTVLCAFVYDGDRALYRDVRTVTEAINTVEKKHGNLFCTYINISK